MVDLGRVEPVSEVYLVNRGDCEALNCETRLWNIDVRVGRQIGKNRLSKTSFEKNCFSAWASTLNMGLINKVDMVCLSPVGYGV